MFSTISFLADRKLRGLSPKTLAWYESYLAAWDRHIRQNGHESPQKPFRAWLDGYSSQTAAAAFRAVRAFELWREEQTGVRSWIRTCKGWVFPPPPEPDVLTVAEFTRIMARLDDSYTDRMDLVIFSLLFWTGARRDAIRLLRVDDVNIHDRTLRVRTKGGVQARIVFPNCCAPLLRGWLRCHPNHTEWLFPSPALKNKPIGPGHLTHRLPELARAAKIRKRVWVHGLRHSAATRMAEKMPLDCVQRQLLHASISTTAGYLHRSLSSVRRAMNA